MPVYNFSNYLLDVPYVVSYRSYPDLNEMKRDFTEKNIRYVFGNNTLDTAENRNPFPQIKEKELVAAKNGFTCTGCCGRSPGERPRFPIGDP